MDYKNEKLNIEIINNIFEIEERGEKIYLDFKEKLAYGISANSKVEALDTFSGIIIEAQGSSKAEAWGNFKIKAYDNSKITLHENSQAEARDNSKVMAWGNSKVTLHEKSQAEAWNNSKVEAHDASIVEAYDESIIEAYDNSKIIAHSASQIATYDNSKAETYNDSGIDSFDNSEVEARGNSIIRAWDDSKVEMYDFSVVHVKSSDVEIKTHNHYGAIIGQIFKAKKTMRVYKKLANDLIATLELSKGQIFQSEEHDKCRTDRALVVAIENVNKTKSYKKGVSMHNNDFIYEVGKEVIADKYYSGIYECSHGIHFFLNRKSAEEY